MQIESDIKKEILRRLKMRSDLKVWTSSSGLVTSANGKRFRTNEIGIGDISGVLKGGKALFIEVKKPGGKQRPSQIQFQEEIEGLGGLYILTDNVASVLDSIDLYFLNCNESVN